MGKLIKEIFVFCLPGIVGVLIVYFFAIGVQTGERNIKRIAIERGAAYITEAGEFEFKQGSIDPRPCKPDGSC